MVFGMTLDQQIKAARKALEELIADEAELSRLEAEQVAEISALKASGSRDFAGLATLEGKRAALASMLSEQRASIDAAREEVSRLEAQAQREVLLSQIAEQADQIKAARQDRYALTLTLRDALPGLLLPILEARRRWQAARGEWVRLAEELGTPMLSAQVDARGQAAEDQARALYAELEARGVDTAALRWNPPGNTYPVVSAISLEPDAFPPPTSPLGSELDWLLPELMGYALAAQARAAGHLSSGMWHSGPVSAVSDVLAVPEVLAATAYAPPAPTTNTADPHFTILPRQP